MNFIKEFSWFVRNESSVVVIKRLFKYINLCNTYLGIGQPLRNSTFTAQQLSKKKNRCNV
ncbi:hypothetical protein D3H55_15510 [Bacillus salacetis]|uniref:Uncharacterized protein n=1 Tax=Bacillus salacetis TaxID=2315464 RepID=A0A3A1QU40_9BACI|nr:hypothetical protein D3H55_15510 [Bacillus salacetis]